MTEWFKPRANGTHTLTTAKLAELLGVTPEGIRAGRTKWGHYRGLVPKILPNGRLLWPRDSIKRLEERSKTLLRGPKKASLYGRGRV